MASDYSWRAEAAEAPSGVLGSAAGELVLIFKQAGVHRPMRVDRYDDGAELSYRVTGVTPAAEADVRLIVDRFVGGGFAGQVYRVKVTRIDGVAQTPPVGSGGPSAGGPIPGLEVGGIYAMKILIPPSSKARRFRDLIYAVGFQAPFALQVSHDAVRAGALWQKFIRRAAGIRFGDQRAVVDVLATFVDPVLGSCGEIREWVDGRTWRFEVDDNLLARWGWRPGKDDTGLNSPEYRAKKTFMSEFVSLLRELGAEELARQYEWWTCKSQPNALKRFDTEDRPTEGLTAVDFRAGLALLPVLPMSPADFKLILRGLARGRLVQFDRGDTDRLGRFIDAHRERFADMGDAFARLLAHERGYRDSQVDVTGHHVRLLYDGGLWSGILESAASGWRVRNVTDDAADAKLRSCRLLTAAFALLGLIPALGLAGAAVAAAWWLSAGAGPAGAWVTAGLVAVSVVARLARRLLGRADYRRHVAATLTSLGYAGRALSAHAAEAALRWHRAGRVDAARALAIGGRPWLYLLHAPLSVLPAFLHRMLTDWRYAVGAMGYVLVRPVRLYFNSQLREQWLRSMVAEGRGRHMLTDEDAETILSRIGEPFIQKYLKSLAVHICTLPVTQVVSASVAIWYVAAHPELSEAQAWGAAAAIMALFQVIPISPGSLTRGLYVLGLVVKERNFRDYNIAVFLGFLKYVGYLAFPIQMAYRYPVLARFMAAHWATGAVHVVPVFGEHGALLEHFIFDLFYNYPLTVRRKTRAIAERRSRLAPRAWHVAAIAAGGAACMAATDALCRLAYGRLPTLGDAWPAVLLVPIMAGALTTIGAGGMPLVGRVRLSVLAGLAAGIAGGLTHAAMSILPALGGNWPPGRAAGDLATYGMWAAFIFTLLATVSALVAEVLMPEPNKET